MKNIKLTIHTATYNRGYIIEQAYRSLQKQTCYDFEWFVTDNGSTDNTEELFKKWCIDEKNFKIHYHKISERGIPRALNYGIRNCQTDWWFMLDSDDYLLPDAVEKILSAIDESKDDESLCGVGFVRINQEGKPIKGVWPKVNENGYVDCTNLERPQYNLDADMCEAYRISTIKKYPFKVWETEIYAPEQLCFDFMALDGHKVRWYKDAIYVCEYIEGGQTKGSWDLMRKNTMGFAMLCNSKLLTGKNFKEKFFSAAQMIALSIVGKNPKYICQTYKKWITALALPYGLLLTLRRREQFKWDDPINRRNFE